MNSLLNQVQELQKSAIRRQVDKQTSQFKKIGKQSNSTLFEELSFCILTANFNAERSIKIQKEIGNGFLTFSEKQLANKLKSLGHRFPNARAKYIAGARLHKNTLVDIVGSQKDFKLREWLVENIKGLGMKEASHFMRNIGYKQVAIIDFHIVDLLVKHKIINRPKTLTKAKYLEIENVLRMLAGKANLNLAELDLYLWYLETGKILK